MVCPVKQHTKISGKENSGNGTDRPKRNLFALLSGSFTIEAALVLPIFLLAVTACLFLFRVLMFQSELQSAMDEAAGKAAAFYYLIDTGDSGQAEEEDSDLLKEAENWLIRGGITSGVLEAMILSRMEDTDFTKAGVAGGKAGLVILGSSFPDSDGAIDLILHYRIKIPFLPEHIFTLNCVQRSRQLVWSGTTRWKDSDTDGSDSEITVYVTKTGTVYHRRIDCSYLKLKIEKVSFPELSSKRNSDGEIYRPCEQCQKNYIPIVVYLTEYGNRYHYSLDCSEISRNVRGISLSEAEADGYAPCSKCGSE